MLKVLAALYVAAVLTWLGTYLIRKADKYVWQGIAYGVLIGVGYILFLCSVMYLSVGLPL